MSSNTSFAILPEISFVEINFISCPKFSGDTGELFKS